MSEESQKKTKEELSALIDGESHFGIDPLLEQDADHHVQLWTRFHLISDVLHGRDPNISFGANVSTRVIDAIKKEP
jgi:negative regulator of sigma E activity